MEPIRHIQQHQLVERFGPYLEDDQTTHWMRWDRQGWRMLNGNGVGTNGVDRNWIPWTQVDWDYKLIERIWELRQFMIDDLGEDQYIQLTVSPYGLILLSSHPSLSTYLNRQTQEVYLLGNVFVVEVDDIEANRIYLGNQDNPRQGCILIDNHEIE